MSGPLSLAAGCLVLCCLALAGCDADALVERTVSRAEVERQLGGMYTPHDPEATVDPSCAGDLVAEVGATQDCHLRIGDQAADVRVRVTGVDGNDSTFEATPFVPAERVAETLRSSLAEEDIDVDDVDCATELLGEVDATVTCFAQPAEGDGSIEVTVTSVDGLLVHFDYRLRP